MKSSTSHLFWLVQTWSNFSHLFTAVHTSVTIYTFCAMAVSRWIFPLRKLLFFDLTCRLVEIAYFAHLIESYSTVHSLSSCIEKISIPQAAHTTVTMYARRKMSFFALSNALIFFSLTSYPTEIAYLNLPYWKLSNFVRLMELYWSKIVDPSRSPCKRFERRNFLVLRPVLLENAYFSSANRELSKGVRLVELR